MLTNTKHWLKHLASCRLIQTYNQAYWSRNKSTLQESKGQMTTERPGNLLKVSERCHLVISPDRGSWQYSVDPTRVLVVLMTWLGAKRNHVMKYSNLYTKQGLDVLIVNSKPKDFLWPPNSMVLAEQIYQVLENNMQSYEHFVCHTMSAGSYNFTSLRMLLKDKGYPPDVAGKFRGQVLDSVVGGAGKGGLFNDFPAESPNQVNAVDRMIEGVAISAKKGPIINWAIRKTGKAYIAMTKRHTLRNFEDALKFFREEPLEVPTLFFASRDDPMCDASVLERVVEYWSNRHSFPCRIKVWDSSPHTQHYLKHTEEYERLHRWLFGEIFTSLGPSSPKPKL